MKIYIDFGDVHKEMMLVEYLKGLKALCGQIVYYEFG